MFIGGLHYNASQDEVQEYFTQFGEVESIKLKYDSYTGHVRGFAFLIFKEVDSIEKVADKKEHKIKGKVTTVKKVWHLS